VSEQASLVWFRQDLRLADHVALAAAVQRGGPIIPVYIWAPEEEGAWAPGAASRWWLHHSLANLDARLQEKGSRLVIRRGNSLSILCALAVETQADAVFWHRRYEPSIVARDTEIKTQLRARGLTAESFNGGLLCEPWSVRNSAGKPFQVFTPFWKMCLAAAEPSVPLPPPNTLPAPPQWPHTLPLSDLALEPRINWAKGLRTAWRPGEDGATAELQRFLEDDVFAYLDERDRPDHHGTSGLSPHLHFGEISPRQIWQAVHQRGTRRRSTAAARHTEGYVRQLGWREFAHHLLFHFSYTSDAPLRTEFTAFPWRKDPQQLHAWQRGQTGYPFVDAGMRELWTTGWMHNRVRMVVASFLVKHLLLSWQDGARWFWDTLVDADLANNTLGWQWTAGCGADAAPYFRIFNPVTQGEKFDPNGDYVRRWVPELLRLPSEWIHQPWAAPSSVLADASVALGTTYPEPIVSHTAARIRALDALAAIKRTHGLTRRDVTT
jgi:deoxyribodipyrimidine photo-lyase